MNHESKTIDRATSYAIGVSSKNSLVMVMKEHQRASEKFEKRKEELTKACRKTAQSLRQNAEEIIVDMKKHKRTNTEDIILDKQILDSFKVMKEVDEMMGWD